MGLEQLKIREIVKQAVNKILDVPEFQREFVWDTEQVKLLAESPYRDYAHRQVSTRRKEPIGKLIAFDLAYLALTGLTQLVTKNPNETKIAAVLLTGLIKICYIYDIKLLRSEVQRQAEISQCPFTVPKLADEELIEMKKNGIKIYQEQEEGSLNYIKFPRLTYEPTRLTENLRYLNRVLSIVPQKRRVESCVPVMTVLKG